MSNDHEMKRTTGRGLGKESNAFQPLSIPDSDESTGRAGRSSRSSRSTASSEALHGPTAPQPPIKAVAPIVTRRGPSHPAWERPLTNQDFPKLRGREGGGRSYWPLLLAAIGVIVILAVLVGAPAFLGRVADLANASGSATAGASDAGGPSGASGSIRPSQSVGPSHSIAAPPSQSQSQSQSGGSAPVWTYRLYKVQSGDTPSGIAKKFGLQLWELELANPKYADGMAKGHVTLGVNINIPPPGVLTHPPTPTSTPTPVAP